MNIKTKIKQKLKEQNDANTIRLRNRYNQRRLKKLVEDYGIEEVALASKLKESTIQQYLRVDNPNIAESTVKDAEQIFKQIEAD